MDDELAQCRSADQRSQIRDAALRQFAELGFKGATIRGIAAEAGVSPGLVQHHFPTKQALREECDAYVFAAMEHLKALGIAAGFALDSSYLASAHQTMQLLVPYVAMTMLADSSSASRFFDGLAEYQRGVLVGGQLGRPLPEDEDVQAIVAVNTAMELGLAVFSKHLYRYLGTDDSDPSAVTRIGRARVHLAVSRLLDEEVEARIRDALDNYGNPGDRADQE